MSLGKALCASALEWKVFALEREMTDDLEIWLTMIHQVKKGMKLVVAHFLYQTWSKALCAKLMKYGYWQMVWIAESYPLTVVT